MINIHRCTRLICVFSLFGLYLVHRNVAEAKPNTEESSIDVENSTWIVDSITFLDQSYLSLVQTIIDKIGIKSERSDTEYSGPTTSEKYGYGFLCVFIISTFSLAGAAVIPFTNRPYFKYINAFFTSLAVGALFANSALELFPNIIQFDPHAKKSSANRTKTNETEPEEDEPVVPLFLWQMLILVLTAYFFYVLELMINVFINYRNRQTEDVHSSSDNDGETFDITSPIPASSSSRGRTGTILSATFPHYTITPGERQTPAIGWMIIIGDGIHNVADGLAIGAAFSDSIILGIAQSIAIACQELPSEIGEMIILIESGFTIRRALLFNFFSACTAFVGFFVGVSLSENEAARTWIFSVTAGIFTYIALVDLWPTLMPESTVFDWPRFACVSAGYLLGVFVMFGLSIITEQLVPDPQKG